MMVHRRRQLSISILLVTEHHPVSAILQLASVRSVSVALRVECAVVSVACIFLCFLLLLFLACDRAWLGKREFNLLCGDVVVEADGADVAVIAWMVSNVEAYT